MQKEWQLNSVDPDLGAVWSGLHCLPRPNCPKNLGSLRYWKYHPTYLISLKNITTEPSNPKKDEKNHYCFQNAS